MLARGTRIALLGGGSISGATALLAGEDNGLAIDFARDLSIRIKDTTTPSNNFSGNVNNKLTYSGPSTKFIRTAAGTWEAGTTLRTEYSAAGVALGVRIEEARTNAALQSSSLDNATWVKTSCTATKTATGPNGTANYASVVTATAANAFVRQNITATSATRISSCFIKRRTGSGAIGLSQGETTGSTLVTNGDFATNDLTGWTNSSTGTGTASGATGAAVLTGTDGSNIGIIDQQLTTVAGTVYVVQFDVIEAGNSLLRVGTTQGSTAFLNEVIPSVQNAVRRAFIATGTTTWIRFMTSGAVAADVTIDNISVLAVVETALSLTSDWQQLPTNSATITNPVLGLRIATSGDAVDVAWMQCEVGAFATSPIETAGATVTRAIDDITVALSSLPALGSGLLMAATFDTLVPISDAGVHPSVSYGATNNDAQIYISTNDVRQFLAAASVTQADQAIGVNVLLAANQMVKAAGSWATNSVKGSVNGGAVVTDSSATMPTFTGDLEVGRRSNGSILSGHLKNLLVLPRVAASDAELQAKSTLAA